MTRRRERIAQGLLQRIAQIVEHRVRDPRLELVTIVAVDPSPDASFARVYYTTPADRADAERALAKAKPFIRRCLADGYPLRRVPELVFEYDPAADRGSRVEQILRELEQDRRGGDSESDGNGAESST